MKDSPLYTFHNNYVRGGIIMAHKNNKNSKNNKKSGQKTRAELRKMKTETANEVGFSKESRKLGKDKPRDENKQA